MTTHRKVWSEEKNRLPQLECVILKYNAGGNTFHASTSHAPPEVPPEVPIDVPPLATQVPPVPEEGQGDTEEFLSSFSFSTSGRSNDTSPHFFTDEDFTPAPPQPTQHPIPSPVSQATPVPTVVPSPVPVLVQPTTTAEQSTPTRASSSKKRYKRTACRILQPCPSLAVVDSGSESPSPPKRGCPTKPPHHSEFLFYF
ncbi:actin cytoskeleton-regulatory complex protein PAN1-like [Hibiscus syriacus]|uniref:actin cytoskeleton-regulatory complex protein PAN1-like n=1 Tax=Hibiscus syriacus TaxID=106335 RepID=UPI0019235DE6|nr:actin cytoskeleton-regulatory complex protein PAN1-like [Hibiscus syriacus]